MQVIPISIGDPKTAKAFVFAVGSPLTRWLDSKRLPIEGPKALLATLHEFSSESSYLDNPLLLTHVSASYLISATQPVILEVVRQYSHLLTVTPSRDFSMAYVSGTLLAFLTAVTNPVASSERLLHNIRHMMNEIYTSLCFLGLEEMFKSYGKQSRADGNFDLVKYV